MNWKLTAAFIAAGGVAVGGGVWWFVGRPPPVRFATASVDHGDVVNTITASGTVNPVVTVQVGSYVSGPIQALFCDYNTRVRNGQRGAKIDPAPYQVIVDEDRAALATAKAQLVKDQANVVYTRLARDRTATLFRQDSGSRDAMDTALNAYDQAVALVSLDAAQVTQKAASMKAAEINLNYTNIVSPVDGTVGSRNVNVGQTVAASFTTPTLFLIATDLTKMQVDTNVSESDIGAARQGASASFTVDAFPKYTFRGVATQVRQAPISVQNVITYDVVVTVGNPDLLLKPGMTATTRITTAQALNVLRVPSQALRFTPTAAAMGGQNTTVRGRAVWVLRDGKPARVAVTVGLDDGAFAQVESGALSPGDPVILSQDGGARPAKTKAPATAALRL